MNEAAKQLLAENKALLEGRKLVREVVLVPAECIARLDPALLESDAGAGRYRIAKVGQADTVNANRRVYPSSEWAVNVHRANAERIPAGTMTGAVDHLGCAQGGNLKDTAIMWHSLKMDANGSVTGEFSVIADHSAGRDLQAQIDAGMGIGFSTFGYASAHEPSDEEMQKYGLNAESDADVVVIEGWELVKIDSVDNPAVPDARLHKQTQKQTRSGAAAATENTNSPPETQMKNLDDLKAQFPAVYDLHVAALADLRTRLDAARADLTGAAGTVADLEAVKARYDALVAKLSDSLTCLATEHGAARPVKDGAEVNADLAARVADLTAKLATAADAARATEAKLAAIEAAKADADRRAAVLAKAAEALEAHAFADAINKLVNGRIADAAFDVAAAERLIADKTAEYDAVVKAAAAAAPATTRAGAAADDMAVDPVKGVVTVIEDEDGIEQEVGELSAVAAFADAIAGR